ncbi:MAG: hypothetical protein ACUVXA_11255 [Candidatus Jordarchaeum sp.]|uniref:hypothetical protein n=1 Tax=Candidatus Jordarchaeum sp. TaxID=2823881 RepID=UPI004049D0B7
MKYELESRTILISGVTAVVSMVTITVSVLGAVITYTGFPLRPLFISWLLLPFPVLPVINTGYSGWYMFISELGIGPSAFTFNVSLIIGGVMALPLFPCLYLLLKRSIKTKIGIVMGMITYLNLIGVGFAPMVLSPLHNLFGAFFFLLAGPAIVLLSYEMLKGKFSSKAIAVYGFLVGGVNLIGIILQGTFLEWIVFSAIISWTLLVGVLMIIKSQATEA